MAIYGILLDVTEGKWVPKAETIFLTRMRPGTYIHAVYSPSVCGYALMSANIIPSYGSIVPGDKNNVYSNNTPNNMRYATVPTSSVWT